MYVCTVYMAGYPSVSCNRIIENKRNKTKKKKKKKKLSSIILVVSEKMFENVDGRTTGTGVIGILLAHP